MIVSNLALLAFSCLRMVAGSADAGEETTDDLIPSHPSIQEITTESELEAFVNSSPNTVVEFFAHWCGFCKKLGPILSNIADDFSTETDERPIFKFARVDSDKSTELRDIYRIDRFPTLIYFKNGIRDDDVQLSMDETTLKNEIESLARPLFTPISTEEEYRAFIANNPVSLVAYVNNDEDSKILDALSKVVKTSRKHFTAARISDADLAKKLGFTDNEVKTFETEHDLSNSIKLDNVNLSTPVDILVIEIAKATLPLFSELDGTNFMQYFHAGKPVVYFFYKTDEDISNHKDTIVKAAKQFRDLIFAKVNANMYERLAENLGYGLTFPSIGIHENDVNKRFGPIVDITEDSIATFVKQYKEGLLEPIFRSEEAPETQEGNVHISVGKTYEDDVNDSSKHVLAFVFSPSCFHCQKFKDTFDQLADKVKELTNDFKFVKINVEVNDLPIEVVSVPHIVFYPKDKKEEPIVYQGPSRKMADLVAFFNEHTDADLDKTLFGDEGASEEAQPDFNFEEILKQMKDQNGENGENGEDLDFEISTEDADSDLGFSMPDADFQEEERQLSEPEQNHDEL